MELYFLSTRPHSKVTPSDLWKIFFAVNVFLVFSAAIFISLMGDAYTKYTPSVLVGEAIYLSSLSLLITIFTIFFGVLVIRKLRNHVYLQEERIVLSRLRFLLILCITSSCWDQTC